MRRSLLATVATVLVGLVGPAAACAQSTPQGTDRTDAMSPAIPPAPVLEYEGIVDAGIALRRLGQTARLLHIGAHPDDENTALFSPLALGRGIDVAYLSLNRGEGGQNGIGPELGIPLGLIRTEELLAARRLDGATQFFTRAVDFGFSKNADETFTHWARDSVLADVVAVIRLYRPDVVIPAWSGTRRDGHGQHEAAGLLAREAVLAAADPQRFPEQVAAGLRPHAVKRYYWSARYGAGGPGEADVELNTGALDPLLGRSYHQVAMASRSRHRSQDMGVPQSPGPRRTAFDRVDPADPPEVAMGAGQRPARQLEGAARSDASLFADIDSLLSLRAGDVAPAAVMALRAYEEEVERTRQQLRALGSTDPLPLLRAARAHLDEATTIVERTGPANTEASPGLGDLRFHLAAESRDLDAATLAVANVRVDAVSSAELVTPGGGFRLDLSIWNGGTDDLVARADPALPVGWTARRIDGVAGGASVPAGELSTWSYEISVAPDAELSHPYFLPPRDREADPGLYPDWPDVAVLGLPFAPAAVRGRFIIEFGETDVATERDAAWVGLDARSGEFRRPLRVVPRASVSLSPSMTVVPPTVAGEPVRPLPFSVRLRGAPAGSGDGSGSRPADTVEGTVHLLAPAGWTVRPASVAVSLTGAAEQTIPFEVTPPPGLAAGDHEIRAELRSGSATYDLGYQLIDYPHIAPHHLYGPATARVAALDVRVADVRVGYVEGVGDGVPEALEQLGLDWEALGPEDLAEADLSRFDVIVAGTRAYELRPDLVAQNGRLLAWARDGGTLISLYNKYPALDGSYAPWPVTIARPHGRVTDETAPVTILEPDHPIFNTPNRLSGADWTGWVQERGLYFWDTWEGPLRPLLSMSDPGEAPLTGSLLVAPLGEGTYVYTALALFRQLPAGVPGAYRLFANLVSLGARS